MIPDKKILPPTLLALNQWVLWFEEVKGDKKLKFPAAPWKTGHWRMADALNPENWTSFDEAAKWAAQKEGYGVGFSFREGGGIVGVDLDKCIEGSLVSEFATDLIRRFWSYTELSPSGKGVHIIVRGELPEQVVVDGKLEMYPCKRYFTFTGRKYLDAPSQVVDGQAILDELFEKYHKHPTPIMVGKKFEGSIPITKLLDLSKFRKVGDKLRGVHPIHGSETGMNFAVDPDKNVWYCYRHRKGGGPVSLIAMLDGIVKCEEYERGVLKGDKFKKVIQAARDRGFELKPPRGEEAAITDKIITDTILGKHKFYCDVHDPNQTLYIWNGGIWHNGEAESIILRELSEIFCDEDTHRLGLENTVNFIKGRAMNTVVKEAPPNLIFFRNGVLDLNTMVLSEPDPALFCVNQVPHDYDPHAKCPNFLKWLSEVVKSEDIPFMQEWMGYGFYRAVPEAAFAIWTGRGQNGKTIWMEMQNRVFGFKNVTSISLKDLTYDDFKPAELWHKLVNVSDDLGTEVIKNAGRLREASSGSWMTVARKFGQNFEMRPYAKITYACNQPPLILDATEAIKLRMKTVEFPFTFVKNPGEGEKPARDRDEILAELEAEIPGIINWALEGLKRLMNNKFKFTQSKSTQDTWLYYQRQADPVMCFIEEVLEPGEDSDFITKEEMYTCFQAWVARSKLDLKLTRRQFFIHMKANEVTAERSREHDMKRVYEGLRFVPPFHDVHITQALEKKKIEEKGKKKEKIDIGKKGNENHGMLEQVEFITDCPAIIGVDGVVYGPFAAGTISSIPRQNAVLLEKKGVVRILKGGAD